MSADKQEIDWDKVHAQWDKEWEQMDATQRMLIEME